MAEQQELFHTGAAAAWYFPTNVLNLRSILASGLLRPRNGLRKYYPDFLGRAPGGLPLVAAGLTVAAIGVMTADSPGAVPCLLELDHVRLKNLLASRTPGGLPFGKFSKARIEGWLWVPGIVPITAVRAIHFPSESEAEDFQLRKLADVPLDLVPIVPSPQLFGQLRAGHLTWGEAPDTTPADAYEEAEALAGGLACLRAFLPSERKWLQSYAALLDTNPKALPLEVWLAQLPDVTPKAPGWEFTLFTIFASLLIGERPGDGFDVVGLVDALEQRGRDDQLPAEIQTAIADWCAKSRAILCNEQPLPALTDPVAPKLRSRWTRAMLLFLLRPEIDRLRQAERSSLRPGREVLALAALLAGMYEKHERLDADLKGDRALLCYLADWKAARLNHLLLLPDQAAVGRHPAPILTIVAGAGMTQHKRINSGPILLFEREVNAPLALRNISVKSEEAGYPMTYDPQLQRLMHVVRYDDGRQQTVHIDAGCPRPTGEETVRIWTACLDLTIAANRKRLTKDLFEKLLLRNCEVSANCRFALSEERSALIVLQDQIVKTVDTEEIRAHIEDVASVADQLESEMGWDHY